MQEMTEADLLRLGNALDELVNSKGWLALKELLDAQIETRKKVVLTPFHDLNMPTFMNEAGMPVASKATDAESRILAVESIKGAIIGLSIAMSLPHDIINDAKEIRAKRESKENS